MHKECDKPFELKNFGATCYLNSGIQALTSCPHFIQGIYELNSKINSTENKNLQKLDVFNELLQSMLSGNSRQNISTNYIFAEWNKTGQQDSFELLAYVINQVFEGIRREKEDQKLIKKGDLAAWLKVELPLRMKMQYDINCECGNKEKSPLQADIALHVSFSNNKSNIRNRSPEIFNMHNMLRQHFDKELIQDFECGKVGCNVKSAQRQLYLLLPLSNTICLHLQRLHWNGNKMEKINNKVTFCKRILIKGEYIKCDSSNSSTPISDTYYYLKSVIVHDGWESCGHYTCYKKCKNKWFYTSDTIIREVAPTEVFDCNPYILFYERDDGNDDTIPMIIKDYPYINLFIHAMASCREFVQLYRKATLHNDEFLNLYRDTIDLEFFRMLFYLIDLSDCNSNESDEFKSLIINKFKNENLLSTANGFLEAMNSKIPLNNLMYVVKPKLVNDSGQSNLSKNLFNSNNKDISVQMLVDNYFELHQTKILKDSCYSSGDGMPLLNTICIIFDESFNKSITLDCVVTVSTSGTKHGGLSFKTYYLKSVIKKHYFEEKCLRYVDGTWYAITKDSISKYRQNVTEYNYKKNIILFYDSIPFESYHILTPDIRKENKANPSLQSQRGIKPIEMVLPPVIVNINENLNVFIQAISSCTNFIDELNHEIPEGPSLVKHLLYLVNLTKGIEIDDENVNEYLRKLWCDVGTTVEKLTECIFNCIFEEILKNTHELPSMVGQIPKCACKSSCLTIPGPFWFIDILANDQESKLQILVDKFFREEIHLNHEGYKGCAESQHITMSKLVMPFSKMICIRLSPDSSNIIELSETLALKGQYWMESSDNKDETYDLKSVIMKDEFCCFRKIDDEWYKVTDSESSYMESFNKEIHKYQPLLLFYEPRIYMVLEKYLNYIFLSLQSNTEFVEWLNKIKENDNDKTMIKYFKQRTDSRDYRSKTICQKLKLSTYDDIYVLMLEIFEMLAMEIESKQNDYGSFPLQVFIKQNTIGKSEMKYILDIDIFNESCSIQQLLDKYFQGELISSDNNTINSFKILDRPLPKVLCIRLNIFNGVDNQIRNNNYDVKLTENILVNTNKSSDPTNDIPELKQYKLMSLIDCFGDGTNNCYACYRRIDHDKWECRTKNDIINVEFNEVLQVKPYIIFYQIDNTAKIYMVYPTKFDDNLRFFNFFHSISKCSKFLNKISNKFNDPYSYLSTLIRVINEFVGNSKIMRDDRTLELWYKYNYDSDINPFIIILSEIFSNNKLDKPTIAIIDVDDNSEYRSESPIIINLKRSLKDIGEPTTIQQLLDRYFILYSNNENGNAVLHQVIEDKLISVYGDPPETIVFYFRNFSAVSNKYRIAMAIILRNKLCSSNSTTWTSCYKGNNCCRKYRLQSVIDNQSQCYKRMNNEWWRISPYVAVLTPESNIQRLTPQILLYE